MSDDVKLVGTHLSPDQLAELDQIRIYYGIERNSDLLRFLIREEARRINDSFPIITRAVNNEAAPQ